MRLLRTKTLSVNQGVRSRDWLAQVTCGTETAARLGVPVGTIVDLGRVAYWHRNPVKRWLGQRKANRGFNPEQDGTLALASAVAIRLPS